MVEQKDPGFTILPEMKEEFRRGMLFERESIISFLRAYLANQADRSSTPVLLELINELKDRK